MRNRLPALIVLSGLAVACGKGEPAESTLPVVEEPPVVVELSNTHDSVYALASDILENIRTANYERLLELRVDVAEFRHIVWDKLPAARPERNLPWSYVWSDLDQKSRNSIRATIERHRGRTYRLMRVEFADETTDYGTYKVHRDARCVVEDESGDVVTFDLFGSVIEMRGRYKAFSYVVD